MEAAHELPAPDADAAASTTPILPPAPARPAPRFERREFDVTLVHRAPESPTSMRGYLYVALGLVAASVAGWFALSEYIYG